jgi:hypothetical protein
LPKRPLPHAAERIERIRGDGRGSRALRHALLKEIARNVAFDAYAWLLTDPETEVGCDPVADVPCMPQLPKLIGSNTRQRRIAGLQ